MTAPSIKQAVKDAVADLDTDPGSWLFDVMDAAFDRYGCADPDHCPSRPAWDAARSDLFGRLAGELEEAVAALLVARIVPALTEYAAQWPDAPRAAAKVAA